MKLPESVIDLMIGADPRFRGAGKGAAEPSFDGAALPFAGVLADVGPAAAPAPIADPAKDDEAAVTQVIIESEPREGGTIMNIVRPQVAAAQKRAGPGPRVPNSVPTKTVEALIGSLFSVAASDRPDKTGTRAPAMPDTVPIGEADRRPNADAPGSDLMAMLLMRSGLPASPGVTPMAAEQASAEVPSAIKHDEATVVAATAIVSAPSVAKEAVLDVRDVAAIMPVRGEAVFGTTAAGTATVSAPSMKGAAPAPRDAVSDATDAGTASVSAPSVKKAAPDLPSDLARIAPAAAEGAFDATPARRAPPALSDVAVSTHLAPSSPPSVAPQEPEPSAAAEAGVVVPGLPASSRRSFDLKAVPNKKPHVASVPSAAPPPSSAPDRAQVSTDPLRLDKPDAAAMALTPDARSRSPGHEPSAERAGADTARPTAETAMKIGGGIAFDAPRPSGAAMTRIAKAVAELAQASTPPAASNVAPAIAPARTMNLRLDQPELGAVDIRMHLAGHELDLRLTVSDRQTFADLGRDRDALVSALGDRHYQLHSLVIQEAAGAPPTAGSHPAASGDDGSGARPDTMGSGDQAGDRRNGHHEAGRSPRGAARSDGGAPSRSDGARRGSLFV